MAEHEVSPESLVRNPKYSLLELLRILLHFYSLRELEKRINVPMQTLWQYHTLRTTPERETAVKLLNKIRESGILREAVGRLLAESKVSVRDLE